MKPEVKLVVVADGQMIRLSATEAEDLHKQLEEGLKKLKSKTEGKDAK